MIVAVLNQKGGFGQDHAGLTRRRRVGLDRACAVLLVDADPQGSALDWAEVRAP